MPPDSANTPRFERWARIVVVFFIAFDIAAFWQWAGGAFQSELGGHAEEGGEYVAGLRIHDRVAGAATERAASLEARKIAPEKSAGSDDPEAGLTLSCGAVLPGFPMAEAAWMTAFGASRISVLLFVAALAAGVGALLYGVARAEFGEWAAIAASALWLCAAPVREAYVLVMPEMFGTLAMFGAALVWGRFLDGVRKGDAILFGMLAAIAILTEGSGVAVLLMAVASLAWMRRWSLPRKPELWIAIGIPVFSALYVQRFSPGRFQLEMHVVSRAATFYGGRLAVVAGLAVALFAIGGVCFRGWKRRGESGRWIVIAALVAAVSVHRILSPDRMEARHLVAVAPGLILLALAGAKSFAAVTSAGIADATERRRREALWVLLLVLLTLPFEAMKAHRKEFDGFGAIVRTLIDEVPRGARILVSSDAAGEGMFISELAMNDRGTRFTIENAGTSLVEPGIRAGAPEKMRERYLEDQDLLAYLTKGRIHYIVLDDSLPMEGRAGFHDQLRRVIENDVRSFWPIALSPIVRDGELQFNPIKIYRVMPGN